MKLVRRTLAGLCALGLSSFGAEASLAQASWSPPRTPDGHADLQGVWSTPWLSPLERPPEADTVVMDKAAAERVQAEMLDRLEKGSLNADGFRNGGNRLTEVRGEIRSALVVDPPSGMLPYRPGAAPNLSALPLPSSDYEKHSWNVRCLRGVGGTPLYFAPGDMLRTIVQTPDSIVIHSEGINDTRIIGVAAKSRPDALRSAYGDSLAHWEGDTLVVKTTRFRRDDPIRMAPGFTPLIVRDSATVIERFTLVSENELLYQFTVDDPVIYERPWRAEYSFLRSDGRLFEYACHEGNYAMENILRGAKRERTQAVSAERK